MNFGIILSYVIAGFLLVAILATNANLNYSSSELTATQMKKNHSKAITEVINHDIPKIGFNRVNVIEPAFVKADSNEIVFYSNIDNSTDESVETISWKYTDTPAPGSKNPHDHILVRKIDGEETEIDFGITRFSITYFDEYGGTTPMSTPVSSGNLENIKQIEIELTVQTGFSLKSSSNPDGRYVTSTWIKRFSPVNLRDN
ncbi:hypothetical protein [Gracilimonas sp.]|uniref:hypothetical protein n=1 Tax=Gracilimonas sp. TaxID=1974203 RepID=UPI003BABF3A1